MTQKYQNLTMREGDDILIRDEITKDGSAMDLTGVSIQFTLSEGSGSAPIAQYSDSDSEVTITDTSGGVVEISLPSADTESLIEYDNPVECYYEVELADSAGNDYTVTVGTITVEPSY